LYFKGRGWFSNRIRKLTDEEARPLLDEGKIIDYIPEPKRMTDKNFGWLRYKNLGWVNAKGLKYIEGYFKKDNDDSGFTIIRIRFWTNRPVKGMRYIYSQCSSLKEVEKFHGKNIII
jgi:transposase